MRKITVFVSLITVIIIVFSLASCAGVKVEVVDPDDTVETEEIKETKDTEKEPESAPVTETDRETETDPEPETKDAPETGEEDPYGILGKLFEFKGVSLYLPKGFTVEKDNTKATATPGDYPTHADNIYFAVTADDYDFFTEENLIAAFSEYYEVSELDLEKGEINGVKYAIADYFLDISDDYYIYQINCNYFFDHYSVNVTFTLVSDDYYDVMIESFYSIEVEG
ncbi:MAG: hypothetical protein IJS45_05080 [Clostridia bacterium]|nr:hypothetical protein [Clostridia bacterium]